MTEIELEKAFAEGRPYFGTALIADQGHNEFKFFKPLVDVARQTSNRHFTIVEVGSWAGASLVAWDKAADGKAQLIAIDKWEPYPGISQEMLNSFGRIESLFWHNMRTSGIGPERLTVYKQDSQMILPILLFDYYDIIFIDGDHRYKTTKADIWNSFPLVRVGGILCGDDLQIEFPEVDREPHRQALAEDKPFAQDDVGYHPGVTQAVWEAFGCVSRFGRLWAMKKTSTGWEKVIL
jgi:predicted O-methyltransferase YrrM